MLCAPTDDKRTADGAGVRYEGEWRDGLEHGVGTLVETDGSAYYGFWSKGLLHGEGVLLSSHLDVSMIAVILQACCAKGQSSGQRPA